MKVFKTNSVLLLLSALLILNAAVRAQSTDQSYPTPVTTNQISGEIKARAIGDARRTSYFYTFDGSQGDVFLNVVTKNFNGDIDVFAAEGLRPLTKITVYADTENSETGRVFYLRKPEKIILRVEGRTPNDDSATFQIKFAGSFVAAADTGDAPPPPEVKSERQSDVIVNSVGTIIGVKPKPTPAPKEIIPEEQKETVAEQPKKPKLPKRQKTEDARRETAEQNDTAKTPEKPAETSADVKTEVVAADATDQPTEPAQNEVEKTATSETVAEKPSETPKPENSPIVTENKLENPTAKEPTEAEKLAQIMLTITLKNGDKFSRPMSEVFSFSTSDGRVTVITKDGKIRNFSIFDVAQMKIE